MAEYQFTLEPFSPAVLDAYRAFPTVLDQSPEKVAWKFEQCPFGRGLAMVVRDEAGAVVGMNVYQAVVIRSSDGQTLAGHQSMDTVVSETARGQGLFTRMYGAYYDQTRADFVWPYAGPFQAGAPQTLTSSCNAVSTWLAQSTNQPPPTQGQRGERGR